MSNNILIIKNIKSEGPGSIEDFFNNTAWNLQTIELGQGDNLPPDLEDIDAVVCMGGPMNVYEEKKYPFLKEECLFLNQALTEEVPILGICLGAQLLAKTLGAPVKKSPVKELGWRTVSLTGEGLNDGLFDNVSPYFDVFQWHEDTFEIPRDGILIAKSESCLNQAFRFGKNAYGLQFHIETTPDMVEEWLNNSSLEKNECNRILLQTFKNNEHFSKRAQIILLNFSKIIKRYKKAWSFSKQ